MFGIALQRLILICMTNHVYMFNNVARLQVNGGATGLDLVNDVSDLYMIWWDREFCSVLDKLAIMMDINVRFKDDVNLLTDIIPWELEYSNGEIRKKENISNVENVSAEEHTIRILNQIANDVDPMIRFTFDLSEKHQDKKLPVLDLKVWLSEMGELMYEFYEKPTKNVKTILASSAISWHQKRTTLTQEAIRRLKNTSQSLGAEIQNSHLNIFMKKLKLSGYDEKFRGEIVKSAKKAYDAMVLKDQNGTKPLFRNRKQIEEDKRLSSKVKWFNKKGKCHNTVLFVPPTPNGELAKLIQKREEELNKYSKLSIKVVEKGGVKLKDLLVKKDPFKKPNCTSKLCPICHETEFSMLNGKNRIPCGTSNVGYRWICIKCMRGKRQDRIQLGLLST